MSSARQPLSAETDGIQLRAASEDVTNEWITGPAGQAATVVDRAAAALDALRNPRRAMVVHGRNPRARDALLASSARWDTSLSSGARCRRDRGWGHPHNLEAARAAMVIGQAVVVLLTAEDQAGLLPRLADEDHDDVLLRGSPGRTSSWRQAWRWASTRVGPSCREGEVRPASDFAGLNVVRLTNEPAKRLAVRTRLKNAGCAIDDAASDWMRPETGGDFDAAAVVWTPTRLGGPLGR